MIVRSQMAAGLRPDPPRTVSQWADDFRMLSQEASSEPGRWRTSRTPYLREIMDALSPSHPAHRVTFIKGAQVGGTEAGNNWAGYVMDYVPGPMLLVQPKDDLVEKVSKQRLTPMIEACDRLREKVYKDNIHEKRFPGGILMLTTAKSASGLRSMPIRYLFLDEVDAYPLDVQGEGDPVNLAIARTRTFPRKKIFECSTPTMAGRSRIESSFELSDQRYYHAPCPHCGTMQVITWKHIKWENGHPETAHMVCEGCGDRITDEHKTWMLENGKWIATAKGAPGHIGFHLSSLYSPVGWYSWAEAASDFLEATGNQDRLRTFVNTVLGETWKNRGDSPDWVRIFDRREDYQIGVVPERALILTAGVDVQKDRLEAEIVGWGPDMESWSVDHVVIEGDVYDGSTWDRLTDILSKEWPHEKGGSLKIRLMAVDSGFATTEVYKWARTKPGDRVMVVKGSASKNTIIGGYTATREGVGLWSVGVDVLKAELYGLLRLRPIYNDAGELVGYPAGYCHFPQYGQEFFEQLTAEHQIVKTDRRGFQKLTWEKARPRNEALDLRNYARAAAEQLKVPIYEQRHWDILENERAASGRPVSISGTTKPAGPVGRTRRSVSWY